MAPQGYAGLAYFHDFLHARLSELAFLDDLVSLRRLALHSSASPANPVCAAPGYLARVVHSVPNLEALDESPCAPTPRT